MRDREEPPDALLIVAAFSAFPDCINNARTLLEREYSTIILESGELPFGETAYYEPSMGSSLKVKLFAFERCVAPRNLADIKRKTIEIEALMARQMPNGVERCINLDPGYLTLSKFVLATTKDGGHRIYLAKGIFAEVTLQYSHGAWQESAWTYPNYRRADYKDFLSLCREYYRIKGHALTRSTTSLDLKN